MISDVAGSLVFFLIVLLEFGGRILSLWCMFIFDSVKFRISLVALLCNPSSIFASFTFIGI